MVYEVKMPQYNMGMAVGTVARWLKAPGDPVAEGEIIAEIESEKATNELTAPQSGILREIIIAEGDNAAVGEVIAIIE